MNGLLAIISDRSLASGYVLDLISLPIKSTSPPVQVGRVTTLNSCIAWVSITHVGNTNDSTSSS
jgi:hypothetical protein